MQKKQGISLIVLVITIIVMIILAGAIILSLNNAGIIAKANEAVKSTNEATIKEVAQMAWAEAYADGVRKVETENGVKGFEARVKEKLEENKIDTSNYNIIVTTTGVSIEEKTESEVSGKPLTEEEYNEMYKSEIAIALKYGTVTNGVYVLNEEYFKYTGGVDLPEEARVLALPYGTTTVGGACFATQPITKIVFPETTTKVEDYAFQSCTSLKEIEGFEYLQEARNQSFAGIEVEELKIASNLTVSWIQTFDRSNCKKSNNNTKI